MAKLEKIRYEKRLISQIDLYWYILYLFTMPLGLLVYRPEDAPTTLQIMPFSTFVMLFGIIMFIMKGKLKWVARMTPMLKLYLFMAIYSIFAAVLISTVIPTSHGVPTITAPAENIVNYFISFLSIYYNFICLSAIKDFKSLSKIFDTSILFILVLGYIQLGLLLGNSTCHFIYETLLDFLNLYNPKALMTNERGVTLFGSEPSSVADMFYVIVPYLIMSIYKKWPRKILHIIMLVLFVFLFLGSGSSSVMILFFFTIGCVLVLILRKKYLSYIPKVAFFIGLFVAIMYTSVEFVDTNVSDRNTLSYLLVGKAIDKHNGSTQMRSSTIAVDMKLFAKYPITGVGLGLQGVWYNELAPRWTRRSTEVQQLLNSTTTISNGGGSFFPVYISAFGIIGIIIFISFLKKYLRYVRAMGESSDVAIFYLISISVIILSMWYVASPKLNESICLMLAIPLVFYSRRIKQQETE